MAILNPSEALHFSSGYVRGRTPQESFREWARLLSTGQRFTEGTPGFNVFRDLSLGEVERLLLLSASHYRRAHDGFGEVPSAWSYVTLYYGSFFAARALMGLFGIWVTNGDKYLGVVRSSPGTQQFEKRKYVSPSGAGSHGMFWELYYTEMAGLVAYLDVEDRFAVQPPGADFDWQSAERNRINYDSFEAIVLAEQFERTFTAAGFPTSLPGVLNTQYRFLESVLRLSGKFAHSFGLNTDAVDSICPEPSRRERVRQLVLIQRPRALGHRAKKRVIHG